MKFAIAGLVAALSVFFLFFRLGHYALWDDEATTALYAQVIRTDTKQLSENLKAFKAGVEAEVLADRYMPSLHMPPLQYHVAAPWVTRFPGEAWAARFPFAVCGFLTIGLMLLGLYRMRARTLTWVLAAIGILGNVSFMLYSRQCRYYALTMLASAVVVFMYAQWNVRWRSALVMVVAAVMLMLSHYLCYVAAAGALIVDYFIWGRKAQNISKQQLLFMLVPQVLLAGYLFVRVAFVSQWPSADGMRWIAKLGQTMMDFNSSEMGAGVLILSAPVIAYFTGNSLLMRFWMGFAVYMMIVGMLSPEIERIGTTARYLLPLIPVGIGISVLAIESLTARTKWLAVPLALLVFGSNFLHGNWLATGRPLDAPWMTADIRLRSTVMAFAQELLSAPANNYRIVSDWISRHVAPEESVAVDPNFALYPLMYHAPQPYYAWLLKPSAQGAISLPDIYFMQGGAPDYIIAFGLYVDRATQTMAELRAQGVEYVLFKQFDRFWHDMTRPELFWHSFGPGKGFFPDREAIYIFKRM